MSVTCYSQPLTGKDGELVRLSFDYYLKLVTVTPLPIPYYISQEIRTIKQQCTLDSTTKERNFWND